MKVSSRDGHAEDHFRRTGMGSVFVPGAAKAASGDPVVGDVAIETPGEHFDRLLTDLNRPARRWRTANLDAVIADQAGTDGAIISRSIDALSKSYQEYLRDLTDLWIGTGRDVSTGIERPSSRRPNRVIHEIVEKVFNTHHAIPVPLIDGYAVSAVPRGTLQIDSDHGHEAAELMFADMLISPWRLKISKCPKCRKYFKLNHWERTYRDGTICGPCTPRRKDERSTKHKSDLRAAADKGLYQKTALRFRRQIEGRPGWRDDVALKEKIAEFLTAQIKRNPKLMKHHTSGRLTGKWLARHKNWTGIEDAVKAMGEAR